MIGRMSALKRVALRPVVCVSAVNPANLSACSVGMRGALALTPVRGFAQKPKPTKEQLLQAQQVETDSDDETESDDSSYDRWVQAVRTAHGQVAAALRVAENKWVICERKWENAKRAQTAQGKRGKSLKTACRAIMKDHHDQHLDNYEAALGTLLAKMKAYVKLGGPVDQEAFLPIGARHATRRDGYWEKVIRKTVHQQIAGVYWYMISHEFI